MERVERVVEEIRRRYDLKFPVNVEQLAKKVSDFRYVENDAPFEGMALPSKNGDYSTILIRRGRFNRRTRFTIAHEIGHVVMPWHHGVLVDKETYDFDDSSSYIEREANHFAIELLAPKWKRQQIIEESKLSASSILSMQSYFGVSWEALANSLIEDMPNASGLFRRSNAFQDFRQKFKGDYPVGYLYLAEVMYEKFPTPGLVIDTVKSNSTSYGMFFVDLGTDLRGLIDEPFAFLDMSAKDISASILSDLSLDEAQRKRMQQKLGGLVGYMNTRLKVDCLPMELFAGLYTRLHSSEGMEQFSQHPAAASYCVQKIIEFCKKDGTQI